MININPYSTLIKDSGISLKYGFLILPNMGYYFTNILEITTSSLKIRINL